MLTFVPRENGELLVPVQPVGQAHLSVGRRQARNKEASGASHNRWSATRNHWSANHNRFCSSTKHACNVRSELPSGQPRAWPNACTASAPPRPARLGRLARTAALAACAQTCAATRCARLATARCHAAAAQSRTPRRSASRAARAAGGGRRVKRVGSLRLHERRGGGEGGVGVGGSVAAELARARIKPQTREACSYEHAPNSPPGQHAAPQPALQPPRSLPSSRHVPSG